MKRLIVACDGTWQNSDSGWVRDSWLPWKTSGHLTAPTNVTRICRALEQKAEGAGQNGKDIQQIVYYQPGLGSANNFHNFLVGGGLGEGIDENIRAAYGFLCSNYEDKDEIVLTGFSRGAFTARCIAGLIDSVGLLTKKGLSSFYTIFKDWQNQTDKTYKPQYPTASWTIERPQFGTTDYVDQLVKKELTRYPVRIKAVAVWDTVGTLGVPEMKLFGSIKLFATEHREYSFVDTKVPKCIDYAYHAMALDERRKPFSPTLWESPGKRQVLKQTWFPGMHSSVGGSYEDTSIPDIALAWIMTQLTPHLKFNDKYILTQKDQNVKFYEDHQPLRTWALGLIPWSDVPAFMYTIVGRASRTPGQYHVIDPITAKPKDERLTNTCEFIHPSVRYRKQQNGPGIADSSKSQPRGTYQPVALAGWDYFAPNQPWRNGKGISDDAAKWDGHGKWLLKEKDGSWTYVVEDRIEEDTEEWELLRSWEGVDKFVMN